MFGYRKASIRTKNPYEQPPQERQMNQGQQEVHFETAALHNYVNQPARIRNMVPNFIGQIQEQQV